MTYYTSYEYPGVNELITQWLAGSDKPLRRKKAGFEFRPKLISVQKYALNIVYRQPSDSTLPATACFLNTGGRFRTSTNPKGVSTRREFIRKYFAEHPGVDLYEFPFYLLGENGLNLQDLSVVESNPEGKQLLLSVSDRCNFYIHTIKPNSVREVVQGSFVGKDFVLG